MAAKRATKKQATKKQATTKPAAPKRAATKRAAAGETLSIAGLSAKARTAIAKAARKRRQSVDAWAAEALEDAAQRTLAGGGDDAVLAELKKMSRKLERLAVRPKPLEKTLDQVQKSVHDLGGQLHNVYEEVREKGSETIDEVRTRTGTVVDEMSDKASETLSQWRKAADTALHGLQHNLDELRHTVFHAEEPKPAEQPPAAAPKETPTRKPAAARSASAGKPPGTTKAKPAAARARAKPATKPAGGT